MSIEALHAVSRQAAKEASAKLVAAQQAEQKALDSLKLQKSALSAMEADLDARTERLQAALQEAAAARSSVDALHAEVSKASGAAQAAQKVPISSSASLVTHPCSGLSGIKSARTAHAQPDPAAQSTLRGPP